MSTQMSVERPHERLPTERMMQKGAGSKALQVTTMTSTSKYSCCLMRTAAVSECKSWLGLFELPDDISKAASLHSTRCLPFKPDYCQYTNRWNDMPKLTRHSNFLIAKFAVPYMLRHQLLTKTDQIRDWLLARGISTMSSCAPSVM